MKKWFGFFALLFLAGCAKNNPEFVPISLNWYSFEGSVNSIDSNYKSAVLDSAQEENCLIAMTRTLMQEESIQKDSRDGMEFDVQYYGILVDEKPSMEFRGQCRTSATQFNPEREILPLDAPKNCNFTVRCTSDSKIKDLKIF